jgi:hypothetical protein
LQFLINKKKFKINFSVIFFQFWSLKPWIRIGSGSVLVPNIKLWIRIRIRKKMNTDPQPWMKLTDMAQGFKETGKVFEFCPGLWIRLHFLRIRIRIQSLLEANTDPNPDPDPIRIQGFNYQKLKKNYS